MLTIIKFWLTIAFFNVNIPIMKTKDITYIGIFIALMVVGAFLKIPLPFISVTFQPFFAILAGIILGGKKGALAITLYMVLGLMGLPIFSLGGGVGYVLTSSFGFILGFILGAFVSGYLYNVKKVNIFLSVFLGMIAIYIIGTPYMYMILHFYTKSYSASIIALGISFIPFIIKDLVLGSLIVFINKYLKNFNIA